MLFNFQELLNQNLTELGNLSIAIRCLPTTTLRTAITTLQTAKFGSLLIAEGTKILGIITERDFLMKVLGKDFNLDEKTVADVMTKSPMTVPRSMRISDAMRLMLMNNFRHLIVSDPQSNLVQIISIKDLLLYIVTKLDQEPLENPELKKIWNK